MLDVGVPLITPVEVLKLSPAGNAGLMDHDVTACPDHEGVLLVMAVHLIYVGLAEVYVRLRGGKTRLKPTPDCQDFADVIGKVMLKNNMLAITNRCNNPTPSVA